MFSRTAGAGDKKDELLVGLIVVFAFSTDNEHPPYFLSLWLTTPITLPPHLVIRFFFFGVGN